MTEEAIEYNSGEFTIGGNTNVIETKNNKGIKCTWNGKVIDNNNSIKYSWNFDWSELKKEGIEELTGYIITKRTALTAAENVRIDVHLSDVKQVVEKTIRNANMSGGCNVAFDYHLTPRQRFQMDAIPYEVMFLQSDKTDAILVVDEKKLHVNKAFLSFHSDFFRALFTSNFEEKHMDEIPIGDVGYEDFGCLLSIVHPQNAFPNDETAEKLLELADRFMMSCVTRTVEHHLLVDSKFDNEKLMWLADKYSMPTLLKKAINGMNSAEKVKKIRGSPGYKDLSAETRAALFDRVAQFI